MSRKLPALNADNRAFWQGGEHGELLIHHCHACSRFFHPPGPVCPRCGSLEVGPRPVSGKGEVLSYTINHQPWLPELEVPYIVAIIELDSQEGLRLLSNLVDIDPSEVFIGMPVQVRFMNIEDVWLPLFEREQ